MLFAVFFQQVYFGLIVGGEVAVVNVVLPRSFVLAVFGTVAPREVGLRLAVHQSPHHAAYLLFGEDGQHGRDRRCRGSVHPFGADHRTPLLFQLAARIARVVRIGVAVEADYVRVVEPFM